ncbi:hypothetical protein KUCAC02_022768 [Chaenocephalus aceratus]|uniref:Uncharacterized protein n=1 Tax=Chaenocephalus aceratus TaxID=36190 RepID=A0ACB9XQE8_CHAAC|nr:hypothetical protein KUCAC02_022768 [Chaenocephalus aceratus]
MDAVAEEADEKKRHAERLEEELTVKEAAATRGGGRNKTRSIGNVCIRGEGKVAENTLTNNLVELEGNVKEQAVKIEGYKTQCGKLNRAK